MLDAFVYIIESPSEEDVRAGRSEGRTLCEALTLAGIVHVYTPVSTQEEFSRSLISGLRDAIRRRGPIPILHLSMHGCPDGIGFTDRSFCSWQDLQRLLSPLANEMEGHLLVCMSSCFGSTGSRMAMHDEPGYTFGFLIGNWRSPHWDDAAVAYVTFYHLLFKNLPMRHCVDAMKIASHDFQFNATYGPSAREGWARLRDQLLRESSKQELE